jgi:hypothetical protein
MELPLEDNLNHARFPVPVGRLFRVLVRGALLHNALLRDVRIRACPADCAH